MSYMTTSLNSLTLTHEVGAADVLNGYVLELLWLVAAWFARHHVVTRQPRDEPCQMAVTVERVLQQVPVRCATRKPMTPYAHAIYITPTMVKNREFFSRRLI